MGRLIDANELKKQQTHLWDEVMGHVPCVLLYDIDIAPTIDAAPVVHGRNLKEDTPSLFECSECGWADFDTYTGDTAVYNYCPNCGAKMGRERKSYETD